MVDTKFDYKIKKSRWRSNVCRWAVVGYISCMVIQKVACEPPVGDFTAVFRKLGGQLI
jgi:hypothetical protein